MTKIIVFITKLIQLIPLQLVSVLGIAQAIVKLIKEVITSIVNNIFPFTPDNGKFEKLILKIRVFIKKFDGWIEKGKTFLLLKLKLNI